MANTLKPEKPEKTAELIRNILAEFLRRPPSLSEATDMEEERPLTDDEIINRCHRLELTFYHCDGLGGGFDAHVDVGTSIFDVRHHHGNDAVRLVTDLLTG